LWAIFGVPSGFMHDWYQCSSANHHTLTSVSSERCSLSDYWPIGIGFFTRLIEHADKKHSKTIEECFPGVPK
jgi:hypothetical protein